MVYLPPREPGAPAPALASLGPVIAIGTVVAIGCAVVVGLFGGRNRYSVHLGGRPARLARGSAVRRNRCGQRRGPASPSATAS